MNQLLTASPRELVIVETFKSEHYRAIESILHNRFRSKRTHREWFELTNEDVDTFIQHCEGVENNLNVLIEYNNSFYNPEKN